MKYKLENVIIVCGKIVDDNVRFLQFHLKVQHLKQKYYYENNSLNMKEEK